VATEVRGTRPAEPAARPGGPAPLGLAIFAALAGLLAAFLLKNQCATHAWADNFQYRHLCYNDIQPLFHVRGVDHALVPYRDIQVEYPVLIGSFMYVVGRLLSLLVHLGVGWTSYNDPGYFQLSALLLAPFSLAVTLLLRPRVTAGRLMIWAVGTPTILYSFLNWDLLAVAAMVWGLVEVEKRRWGLAGVAFALGASAKLFPAFLVPAALLAAVSMRDRKGATRLVLGSAATALAVNVPWMLVAFSRWMGVWKFHAARYPDFGTIWYWFAQIGNHFWPSGWWQTNVGGYGSFIGDKGLIAFVVVWAAILLLGWYRRSETQGYPVAATGLGIIASFMVLSKVHSPQYALWVAPLLVMLNVPWWQVLAYLGSDLILFVSGFYWFVQGFSGPTPGWERIFEVAVFARTSCLIVLAVIAATESRRLAPEEPASPAPAAPPPAAVPAQP